MKNILKKIYLGNKFYTPCSFYLNESQVRKIITEGEEIKIYGKYSTPEFVIKNNKILLDNKDRQLFFNEKEARKHHAKLAIARLKMEIDARNKEILERWDKIRQLNNYL